LKKKDLRGERVDVFLYFQTIFQTLWHYELELALGKQHIVDSL